MPYMTTLQFAAKYPEAYNALPSPYQNDNCLVFSGPDVFDRLFCNPRKNQVNVLGCWVAVFEPGSNEWRRKDL